MTRKYHVTNDNRIMPCEAQVVENCIYSGERHYFSKNDAESFVETQAKVSEEESGVLGRQFLSRGFQKIKVDPSSLAKELSNPDYYDNGNSIEIVQYNGQLSFIASIEADDDGYEYQKDVQLGVDTTAVEIPSKYFRGLVVEEMYEDRIRLIEGDYRGSKHVSSLLLFGEDGSSGEKKLLKIPTVNGFARNGKIVAEGALVGNLDDNESVISNLTSEESFIPGGLSENYSDYTMIRENSCGVGGIETSIAENCEKYIENPGIISFKEKDEFVKEARITGEKITVEANGYWGTRDENSAGVKSFISNLDRISALEEKLEGTEGRGRSKVLTTPPNSDRVIGFFSPSRKVLPDGRTEKTVVKVEHFAGTGLMLVYSESDSGEKWGRLVLPSDVKKTVSEHYPEIVADEKTSLMLDNTQFMLDEASKKGFVWE